MSAPTVQRSKSISEGDDYAPPKDYEELFEHYFDGARQLVMKLGISPQNSEDVTMRIYERLIAREVLQMFDAQYAIEHDGRKYKARFAAFLGAHVEHYCRGMRDQEKRLARREPLVCDRTANLRQETSELWVEANGPAAPGADVEVEANDMREQVRARIASVPVRGRRNMLALYDEVMDHADNGVERSGRWINTPNRTKIAEKLELSESTVGKMLMELRDHVAKALVEIDPAQYGRLAGAAA